MENSNKKNEVRILVEGMMCPHCEASVKSALGDLSFVDEALADHTDGTVSITLSEEFDENIVKTAIEEKGYTFKGRSL